MITKLQTMGLRASLFLTSRAPWAMWAFMFAAFCCFVIANYKFRVQYTPDSQYYIASALHFSGMSKEDAHATVLEIFSRQGKGNGVAPVDMLFNLGVTKPRIVYPLLSVPFVWIFGTDGMMVIPLISMGVLAFGMMAVIGKRYGPVATTVVPLLLIASSYMMFFGLAAQTDGPAAAFGFVALCLLPIWRDRSKRAAIGFFVVLILLAYTRQAAELVAGGVLLTWFLQSIQRRSVRNPWLPFAVASAVAVVGVRLAQARDGGEALLGQLFLNQTGVTSWTQYPLAWAKSVWHIVYKDASHQLLADHAMFLLLLLAFIGAALTIRRAEGQLFVGVMIASALLNGISTIAVDFRYEMPILAFVMLAAAVALQRMWSRWPGATAVPEPDVTGSRAEADVQVEAPSQ